MTDSETPKPAHDALERALVVLEKHGQLSVLVLERLVLNHQRCVDPLQLAFELFFFK
jgi:hypothetical protein